MHCLGRGITPTMVYGRKSGMPTTSAETVAAILWNLRKNLSYKNKKRKLAFKLSMHDRSGVENETLKQELLS